VNVFQVAPDAQVIPRVYGNVKRPEAMLVLTSLRAESLNRKGRNKLLGAVGTSDMMLRDAPQIVLSNAALTRAADLERPVAAKFLVTHGAILSNPDLRVLLPAIFVTEGIGAEVPTLAV